MGKKNKLNISAEMLMDDLSDVYWRVKTTDSKGVSSVKVLTQETFVNLLKSSTIMRKEQKKTRLGEMPYGYVDCLHGSEGTYTVAVLYEAKKRGVKYYNDTYFIPHPNMLFIFKVKKGVLLEKSCYAVIDDQINDNTPLYNFPFGNVGESGSMCFGNIKIPKLDKIGNIDELVTLFLGGIVNDDLYSAKEKTTKGCKQFELYRMLEKRKTFPNKLLIPAKIGYCSSKQKVFKDVFN